MTAEIKVLHTVKKVTKDGRPYLIHHCLIVIEGNEYIRKFYDFLVG